MKNILLSFILIFTCGYITAQNEYEKSEPFQEPGGWTKLVQLRNNNTGLMEVTDRKGIIFTLFNPQRKKITSGKLLLKQLGDNLAMAMVEGTYDIAGDFVTFIITTKEKQPVIFRIIVDGNTGKLKSEELVDRLPEVSQSDVVAVPGDDMPAFTVEKDPETDFYVVIKYNPAAREIKNCIQVTHYGPDHQVINQANYFTPADKYKYIRFLAAYVHGSDYVLIATSAFNTKKSGGEATRYYAAQLNSGKSTFIQKELEYIVNDHNARCYFVINKPIEMINMLLILDNTLFNQYINPTSLALEKPYSIDGSNMNKLYTSQLGNKKDFNGMLEGTYVDAKGNVTFLLQENTSKTNNSSVNSYFGDVALITMSPEGKEVSSAVFPYRIVIASYRRNPLQFNYPHKGANSYGGSFMEGNKSWYTEMDFISTETASYIFFNNTLANMDKDENSGAGLISGVSETNGVMYTYKNGKITREFMLGRPKDKKEAKFINPGSSDYYAAAKTYVTIITDGATKKSNVVWLKLAN